MTKEDQNLKMRNRTRAVVNTSKGKMDTDLRKSRWIWRPKGNYLDHVSKDSGSFMLKKVEYVNPKDYEELQWRLCRLLGSDPKAGKSPSISFMRPFGCPLTILNTLDSLGKFDGKSNEGYLLGYSTTSKAFRVHNKRTKRVEENLHIDFMEDQPNMAGTGPNWMFDLDFLTNSMNYIPVSVENQVNVDVDVADKEGQHQITEDEQVLHDELEKMIAQEVIAKALDDATRQYFEEKKRNIASQKECSN
ncbi:hypothetical protein Tco_0656814 [Tanacetum coccineum]|uniref:Retroviral polymerase SH3-like domain-containing protein n=1 Tax=Tanacetum coccineum TaxID=301880 RepID=A0ABQ4XAI3_9ASTR